MNDAELEARLRRFRPASPDPELRERIFAAKQPLTWPWAAAAAALLLATQMLTFASRQEVAEASGALGPAAASRVTDELAAMLGGDEPARELAELIVFEQQLRAAASAATDAFDQGERQ